MVFCVSFSVWWRFVGIYRAQVSSFGVELHPSVRPLGGMEGAEGARGLVAARPVAEGSVLVRVPLCSTVRVKAGIIAADVALAGALLEACEESVAWAHYAGAVMPALEQVHAGTQWDDAQLARLEQPLREGLFVRREENLRGGEDYARRECGWEPKKAGEFESSKSGCMLSSADDFRWALANVHSRSFGTQELQLLCPVADLLNHEARPMARPGDPPRHFLQPWRVAEEDQNGEDGGEFFELLAWRDFAAGEELTLPYGDYANVSLVCDYGFALRGNPAERYALWADPEDMVYDLDKGVPAEVRKLALLEARVGYMPIEAARAGSGARALTDGVLRLLHATEDELEAFEGARWGGPDGAAMLRVPVGEATRKAAQAMAARRAGELLAECESSLEDDLAALSAIEASFADSRGGEDKASDSGAAGRADELRQLLALEANIGYKEVMVEMELGDE